MLSSLSNSGESIARFQRTRTADKNVIIVDGKSYSDCKALLKVYHKELEDQLLLIALIVNHIFSGSEYKVIENPEEYHVRYQTESMDNVSSERSEKEQGNKQYKFDVTKIEAPSYEGKNIVFFVEKLTTQDPFKVLYNPAKNSIRYIPRF